MKVARFEGSVGHIIKIKGIANSRTMIVADSAAAEGLNLETWQEDLAKVCSFVKQPDQVCIISARKCLLRSYS